MYIGVDWGGTKMEVIALSPDGVEAGRIREDTPKGDYDGCLATIARMVAKIEEVTGTTGSVGVGIPGSLEPESRRGKGGNSTWINGRPIEADLRRVLHREVRVRNDADCLAMSEATDGAGAGYRVVFAVIVGTGAGAGVALDGRAHHGPNNSAGEWAHNPLPFPTLAEVPGPACYCGRHGCLETWISGTGFCDDYARHKGSRLSGAEIIQLARGGDHLARMVYERYVNRLARGLAVVVNVLDPDVIVLGGGMSNIAELYDDLPSQLTRSVFSTVFHTPIVKAVHGDSSGVRGAAWLWQDRA
jgi:fructokinase